MKTTAVLCADRTPRGLRADIELRMVPGLCRQPEQLGRQSIETDRLLLGVCPGEYGLGALQREVGKLGLDALGVELVDLAAADGDVERLGLMVAAAAARAAAFAGTQPGAAKLSFPPQTSRRSLLTFTAPEYRAAPRIELARCVARNGCRACVAACPRGALSFEQGSIVHDIAQCEPCGICVTSCPAAAISNPATTPAQLEAQIGVLLGKGPGRDTARGIAFVCSRATVSVTEIDWYPVTVACTAMVTPAWMLAPLVMGAGSVAVVPCGEGGCPLGRDALVAERLDYGRQLLGELGLDTGRLGTRRGELLGRLASTDLDDPFGPLGAAEVLTGLAAVAGAKPREVSHRASPVGVVSIDGNACTACANCAAACPTGALTSRQGPSELTITFDAARCVACGQCTSQCPEEGRGAISLQRTTDFAALGARPRDLYQGSVDRCVSCGEVIAPAAMIDRLADLLGADDSATVLQMKKYCVSCRRRPIYA